MVESVSNQTEIACAATWSHELKETVSAGGPGNADKGRDKLPARPRARINTTALRMSSPHFPQATGSSRNPACLLVWGGSGFWISAIIPYERRFVPQNPVARGDFSRIGAIFRKISCKFNEKLFFANFCRKIRSMVAETVTPPTRLRRARLLRGATLQSMVDEIRRICDTNGTPRGVMGRGELSKIERAQRWVSPWQLVTLARYHQVSPGELCEWLLADRLLWQGSAEADDRFPAAGRPRDGKQQGQPARLQAASSTGAASERSQASIKAEGI